MASHADRIFYGGDIITMDESNPCVEALAVKGDTILKAGKQSDVLVLKGPSTEMICLKNQTLLPGFIEPHQHATSMALMGISYINISAFYYTTYECIEKKMKDEVGKAEVAATTAETLPWCFFIGWDPELIPDLPNLSADFLDGFSQNIPIFVAGQSLHVAWVNHKAFEVAGINDDNADQYGDFAKDENGHLTGKMFEEPAIKSVVMSAPKPSPEELQGGIKAQWKDYASRGFTTVTDLSYDSDDDLDRLLEEEASSDTCPIRLGLYTVVHGPKDQEGGIVTLSTKPKAKCCPQLVFRDVKPASRAAPRAFQATEKLWKAGVKIVADGSPHCGTMAIDKPFLDPVGPDSILDKLGFPAAPNCGTLNYSNTEMEDMVKSYHNSDPPVQVAIHCHGERAIKQVLDAYEKALDPKQPGDVRHRIEHLGLGTEEHITKAAQLNLALSFFVCHLYFYGKSFTQYIFGADRTNRWTPLSLATKHGLPWTIHQDQPAFPGPPLPFANMRTAVTRTQRDDEKTVYGPDYRVPIHEAVKAYTINAAWQLHKEGTLGSLIKDKKADLVILSQNPYKVDPMKLDTEIQVMQTFLNGQPTNASEGVYKYPMESPEGKCYFYAKEK